MTTPTPNGGPAFPTDAQSALSHDHYEGMTLRDYFAAKAMEGIISKPLRTNSCGNDSQQWGIVSLQPPHETARMACGRDKDFVLQMESGEVVTIDQHNAELSGGKG